MRLKHVCRVIAQFSHQQRAVEERERERDYRESREDCPQEFADMLLWGEGGEGGRKQRDSTCLKREALENERRGVRAISTRSPPE